MEIFHPTLVQSDLFCDLPSGQLTLGLFHDNGIPRQVVWLHEINRDIISNPTVTSAMMEILDREKAKPHLQRINPVAALEGDQKMGIALEFTLGTPFNRVLTLGEESLQWLPPELVLYVAIRTLATLASWRDMQKSFHGILHPASIWLTYDGEVKLFGSYLRPITSTPLRHTDMGKAISNFLPEVVRKGERPPHPNDDIWSLGAISLRALSGTFDPESVKEDPTEWLDTLVDPQDGREPISEDLTHFVIGLLGGGPTPLNDLDSALAAGQALLQSGAWNPSPFQNAMYLHNLLRGEEEETNARVDALMASDLSTLVIPKKKTGNTEATIILPPQEEDSSPTIPAEPAESFAKPKNHLPLIVGIIVIVVILAGVGIGWMRKSQAAKEAQLQTQIEKANTLLQEEKARNKKELETTKAKILTLEQGQGELESKLSQAKTDEEKRKAREQIQKRKDELAKARKAQTELEKKEKADSNGTTVPTSTPPSSPKTPSETPKKDTTPIQPEASPTPGPTDTTSTEAPTPDEIIPAVDPDSTTETTPETTPPAPKEKPPHEGPYQAFEVEVAPVALNKVKTVIPGRARTRLHSKVHVIIKLLVNKKGRVAQTTILRPTKDSLGLGKATAEAMEKLRFSPALVDGKPVDVWITKSQTFNPKR